MKSGKSFKRLVSATAGVVVGGIASVGPAAPAPAAAASLPDLQVTVVVTPAKATYAVGDAVTTTFVVKNVGTATAKNARIFGGDEDGLTRATDPPTDTFDLVPGETHSVAWAGTIDQAAFVQGFVSGLWFFNNDAGEAKQGDNFGRIHIPVPGGKGTMTGKVFVDVKGSHDTSQPGLAGAKLTVTDSEAHLAVTATTDSTGRYTITGLQAGDYVLTVANWKIEGDDLLHGQVKAGEVIDTSVALVPGSQTSPTPTCTPSSSAAPALPVTGGRTGLMFAIGAGVVLLGGAAVVVGRRRRNRFVAPD